MQIQTRVSPRLLSVLAATLGAIATASLVVGCNSSKPAVQVTEPAQTPAAAPAPSAPRRYDMQGVVMAVQKDQNKLVVQHGDIPGFMNAMTMAYPVTDPQILNSVKPNDNITAQVVVSDDGFHLENVAVVPKSKPNDQSNPPAPNTPATAPAQ